MTAGTPKRPLVRFPALARKGAGAAIVFCAAWFVIEFVGIPARDPVDFGAYYDGARALAAGMDPYQHFVRECVAPPYCGYAYPPLLAELVRPLTVFERHVAAQAWLVLDLGFLLLAGWLLYRAVGEHLSPARRSLLLAASLLWLPLYQGLWVLQVVLLLLVVQAGAAWAFVRGRDAASGILTGVGALLRVTPLVMAPVYLRSRQDLRRPAGLLAMAATIVGGSLLLLPTTRLYIGEVLPRQAGGNDILENLSLPAVLDRGASTLVGHGVHLGLLASLLSVLLLLVTWRTSWGRPGIAGRALAFAAFGALMPLLSPVTWTYHLTAELVTYALVMPWLRPRGAAFWLVLASYPLMWVGPRIDEFVALLPGVAPMTGPGGLPWLLLTSLNTVGMLALWVGTLGLLRMLGDREPGPEPHRAEGEGGRHLRPRPAAQGAPLTSQAPSAGSPSSSRS